MSDSIGDAAKNIRGCLPHGDTATKYVMKAIEELESMLKRLLQASAQTAQADAGEAAAQIQATMERLREAIGGVQASQTAVESVAARC
jgi:ElaB/YqjD/DUF883 family membrane-anchored ribosome-binding protein